MSFEIVIANLSAVAPSYQGPAKFLPAFVQQIR